MEKVELDYQSPTATRGGLAKAAMILGTVGFVTSFFLVGIIPGIAAIVLGLIAARRIEREPCVYYGLGFARAGAWLGVFSCLVPMGIAILLPCGCGSRELSNRSACGANMRGIMQSMNVYAADNGDAFPLLPYASYRITNSGALAATVPAPNADEAIKSMYGGSGAQDGSVLASVWLLVLKNYTSPKQYMCKDDPFVSGRTSSELTSATSDWHINFQGPDQISYAFAYPYAPDGKPGAWWRNTTDSALPIAGDMPPLNGTGKPARNVSPGAFPADPHSWNSPNHKGDGQNIGFADGHAEFVRRPDIGQDNDNIFTVSGIKGVSEFGGTQPAKAPITVQTDKVPFDIVMVPARNLDTGGI
jgi:prepilin-type processing-associated H-X9-DG protein